jgi:Asp-tRNA(Asn)/Glu-tRNA(Gln) amidotransferase A subunit family amidase
MLYFLLSFRLYAGLPLLQRGISPGVKKEYKRMGIKSHFTLLFIILPMWLIAQQTVDSSITVEDVQHAETIIGLTFTNTERDSMLEGLKQLLQSYQNLHTLSPENSIPPALLFNPIPQNWQPPTTSGIYKLSDYSDVRMPESSDDLAFYSVGELAELLRIQKLTSLELTRFCLERLKKYGPVLECVITLTEELALKQAGQADKEIAAGNYRGLLHGIPYGIKDLFAAKGYKTTWGATPYKNQMIDLDATVVKKLQAAGAVLVAKLTMGALAWGDRWYGGRTRNPWNTSQGSSGSSAGSAAAVSAGLVPFAIGTETWGSIVSPSTVCGTTGLRPTFGRVSRYGAMALSWSMDKIGPICRTVEDCAIVFKTIMGPDTNDPSVSDYPFSYQSDIDIKNLRIGYVEKDFAAEYPFKTSDSLSLVTLRAMGAKLIPIELPDLPVADLELILSAEAAAAFDELTRSNRDDLLVRQIKNAWPNEFRQARLIPAVEYINANRIRYQLIQAMQQLMQDIDLYLAPSWQGDNLLLTNLTGHPCVVLPNGFHEGTPTSITFIGRLFDEGTILAVARAYQNATTFHQQHPPLE